MWRIVGGLLLVAVAATALALAGWLTMGRFVDLLTLISVIAPIVYFVVMFRSPRVTTAERGRLRPYVVLFLASVAFNFILFQAYSTMMLLASTNARTEILGFHFPPAGTPRRSAPSRWRWLRSWPRCGPGWAAGSRTPPTRSPSG